MSDGDTTLTGAQQERRIPNPLSLRTLLTKSVNKSSQRDTIQTVRETKYKTKPKPHWSSAGGLSTQRPSVGRMPAAR